MDTRLPTTDYKKWLLYSFNNQGFEGHYDLFKTLETGASFGTVALSKSHESESLYTISADVVSDKLCITEVQRTEFLKYLKDNYFHADDIDEVKTERIRSAESSKHHNFVQSRDNIYFGEGGTVKVKPHPKETTYFNLRLGISIVFYVIMGSAIFYGVIADMSVIFGLLFLVPVVLVWMLMRMIFKGIFVGMIRGSSVRITKDQFPEIYAIIDEQAKELNLDVPEIYITSGAFNAFVTKFSRSHILMIYSEVIETTLRGNYDVLRYVTAHELCHIRQKHLLKEKYLFPSRIIPFLGLAYSRACEYTCDRTGYHFSPQGSVEGIMVMTTGKDIHSKFNIELHIKNCRENEGFWTWLSEKFLTHPHHYKRLVEIRKYSEYN